MKAEGKTVERAVREAMNRRLSGLQSSPVLDAQIRRRIAQEEEPKMKKKLPVALVFALVLVSLGAVALAAGLILSPRVTAVALADQALEDTYGITLRMQSFFERTDETQPDGSVRVVYTGSESFRHVLGTYTAEVRNGKASVTWSLDGTDTKGMFEARAWGPEQLKEIMAWNEEHGTLTPYIEKAAALAAPDQKAREESEPVTDVGEDYFRRLDQNSADAMAAAKLTEDAMAALAREAVALRYGLTEAEAEALERYIPPYFPETMYVLENGKYCLKIEFFLSLDPSDSRAALNGAYVATVNVETGAIENLTYEAGYGEG